jgi:hypothetical protein
MTKKAINLIYKGKWSEDISQKKKAHNEQPAYEKMFSITGPQEVQVKTTMRYYPT